MQALIRKASYERTAEMEDVSLKVVGEIMGGDLCGRSCFRSLVGVGK